MDLDFLSWNCRGICGDTTRRALKDLILQNRPQIMFLCENKISATQEMQRLKMTLGFSNMEFVLSNGRSGGIAMFWNDDVKLEIGTKTLNHIDAVVVGENGYPSWRITGFYGYPATADRDKSWQLLRDLADLDSLPWVVIGDFNEILNNSEKVGGAIRPERQMRGFRDALGYGDLLDMGFHGAMPTWGNSETLLRLDRAICTASWIDIFHHAKLFHLPPSDSDHVPILLKASTALLAIKQKNHRFQFEEFWTLHEECDGVVSDAWQEEVCGVPMYSVVQKIKRVRVKLDSWQRITFWGRQVKMMAIRNRLEELMGSPITVAGQKEKKGLFEGLQNLLHQEELFWRQRSKTQWLTEGDRNTSYFHKKAQSKKRKKTMTGLFDAEGNWYEDDVGITNVVSAYFTTMFQATPLDMGAVNTTLAAISPCVSQEMNSYLNSSYTAEEIKVALFQMGPTKSPGPDGMPPLFFQRYCSIVGPEIVNAVQDFFLTGRLLKQINYTHVCLIPKVNNPEHMLDLRPIALCNVIYKIVSKVIANQLKVILPSIISPYQSAFVPGRLITDNILVANEIAHFVHIRQDGKKGYMALQLDLSKAYDRMEWEFLKRVLIRFGFSANWIQMVMQCDTTVRYSFLVRGKPRGYLTPSRGLRQGDPLSPYLFLLGAEGFSALFRQKLESGALSGVKVCSQAPPVNHLLFADDSMLYAEASISACQQIQEVIDIYCRVSGQLVNFDKSSIVFSKNVVEESRAVIVSSLGMEEVESHERYLGLPTYVGRKKTTTFEYIKDRLETKLAVWQGKLLNGAGKDLLIRVVAQALPSYAMSVYRLTQGFCEELEQMCARFWWGSTLDQKKIHWKKWSVLCNSKETGGLGFRSLTNFNTTMLAKQAWRIISEPTSLVACIYKAKYFPDCSFWEASVHHSPSFSWRSIFGTREVLRDNVLWQVGDGSKIGIYTDRWIPGLLSGTPSLVPTITSQVSLVSELIVEAGEWDVNKILHLFSASDATMILNIPLSRRLVEDRLTWKLAKDGKFSVKSTYRYAFATSLSFSPLNLEVGKQFWLKLWKVIIPNKAKVHIWRMCLDILPTLGALASKRIVLESNRCVLCDLAVESSLHLCRDCPYTKAVIQLSPTILNLCYRWGNIHMSTLSWLSQCAKDLSLIAFGELLYTLWAVWKERNERVRNQKNTEAIDIRIKVAARLHEFCNFNKTAKKSSISTVKWKPPPVGSWKVNVDGAYSQFSGKGGCGFVIRDFSGNMIAGGAWPLQSLISAEHAEVIACGKAVDFVIEQGLQNCILETDASEVKRQLAEDQMPNTTVLGRLYEDLWNKLKSQQNWLIYHTKRIGNIAAHTLASHACSLEQAEFYFSTPRVVQAAIAADICTL